MQASKVERLGNFLRALSLEKVKELQAKHLANTLTNADVQRVLVFKDLPLEEEEKQELLTDNYMSIESRVAVLNKQDFFNESIMIIMMFFEDKSDENALYDSTLKIEKESLRRILYFLCMALHQTKQFLLCQPYIDLLHKLVILYPSDNNPPKELMDRIGYQVYSNL